VPEGTTAQQAYARDQRVRHILRAGNANANFEIHDKTASDGRRIIVVEAACTNEKRRFNPDCKCDGSWEEQGMEGHANPLFVEEGAVSFCLPHSEGHKISDW
jgi:hypothetical protein